MCTAALLALGRLPTALCHAPQSPPPPPHTHSPKLSHRDKGPYAIQLRTDLLFAAEDFGHI